MYILFSSIRRWLVVLIAAAMLWAPAQAVNVNAEKLLKSITLRFGSPSAQKFRDWQKLVEEARQSSNNELKLQKVNDFFNRRTQFVEDSEAWGQSDYWATPMETLGQGKGDCEDFAIAKYFTLLAANVEMVQLRLIYVKAKLGGAASSIVQAHMVLAYYSAPDAEPAILDNLIGDIRPASQRADLTPVFSFNSQGIWSGISAGGSASQTGTNRLSRWQDLLNRAQVEGFE